MTNETTASQPKSIGGDVQARAWMIWLHGPCGTFENKDDAQLEIDQRNRLYPDTNRKLLELRAPAAQASATSYAECCDTPSYCGSVRRCTAKDSATIQAAPGWDKLVEGEKWCLGCDKEGHHTNECHSTHGLNTPEDRELYRLCLIANDAATIQEPVMVAEPVGESFHEKLAREMREGTAVFVSASKPAAPMVAAPVAYADPKAFENFSAGTATNEWMWAKPDAGLVPLYRAAPIVADPAGAYQALVDVRHAIQFSCDSVGGIDKMPVMMHHDGTVVEFIDAVLSGAATVKAVPSEALGNDDKAPRFDSKLLVDVATGVIGQWNMLENYDEEMTDRFCKQLHREFDAILTDIVDAAARYDWMRHTFVDDEFTWPDDVADATNGALLDKAIDRAIANFAAPLADKTGGGE